MHDTYFNDKYHEINYLPTIFYINEKSSLISKNDDLPVFSIENLKVQSEFRPSLSDFETLVHRLKVPLFLN